MEDVLKRLHAERQGADFLLSQMMPREIAAKLQNRHTSPLCSSLDEICEVSHVLRSRDDACFKRRQ